MPLIHHENIENGEIGLWKISETADELYHLAHLSAQDEITFSGITAPHRQKEWLATRALLNALLDEPQQISYHDDGRPYLENNITNISITHSTGYIAVLLHTSSIPGIDIELLSRQVGRVASRFLSPEELTFCRIIPEHSNYRMLFHWCAKEAIFKIVPLSNIEFATEIQVLINDLSAESGSFHGTFHHKTGAIPITLYYQIVNEVLIVWGWVEKSLFNLKNNSN